MTNDEAKQLRESIHGVRNALNNIVLNAELVTVLLANSGGQQNIESSLASIVKQCHECDKILTQTRKLAND